MSDGIDGLEELRVLGRSILLKAVERKTAFGQWRPKKQVIEVTPNLTMEFRQATVLHELLHVLSDDLSLDLSEKTVNRLSNGLWAVISDNPELVRRWLHASS